MRCQVGAHALERVITVRMVKGYLVLLLLLVGSMVPALTSAQDIDIRFSEELISELGYPLVEVHVGPDGIEAPSGLTPGLYQVRLSAAEGFIGYMNIVQAPEGLDQVTAEEQMLLAGAYDLPQEGWTYFGGSNTPGPDETASFVIELAEGEYSIAASYYTEDEGSEIMRLSPLSVSADAGTPGAVAEAPDATVTLEMTDDPGYIVMPESVPAGPQIWRFENTGTERSHHVVMVRIPDGTTGDDIIGEFSGMMTGTPPAEDGLMSQMVWTGYGAMQSGGTVTYTEFDLKSGTYAVICYIMDDEESAPHMMEGMVTTFVVE
jgi:hypothetical protein